jgi:hypothetical protein
MPEVRRATGINWQMVGHRLRLTRLALDISERTAAAAFNVTLRTYRRYEQGRCWRGDGCLDFAELYDISLDWLIRGDTTRLGAHLSKLAGGKVAILKRP